VGAAGEKGTGGIGDLFEPIAFALPTNNTDEICNTIRFVISAKFSGFSRTSTRNAVLPNLP
jgi:hypothetical protein